MVSGPDAFKKGLDQFLEETSLTGHDGQVQPPGIRSPQNARWKRVGTGCRYLAFSLRHPAGHCETQETGLKGPLA